MYYFKFLCACVGTWVWNFIWKITPPKLRDPTSLKSLTTMCFLVDVYFCLLFFFRFCFPCMVGTSTGTACDGSGGSGRNGERVQGWAARVEQALFLSTDGLRYRPGRDHV